MITKKALEEEIDNLIGLNNMIQAYEEIAASRIMRSRQSVLTNRTYMDEINEIFEEVIASYRKQVDILLKDKKNGTPGAFTFMNKNGKTLYLLISANTGLYGSIVKRTFDLFVEKTRGQNADLAIVGRLGLSMWQQTKIKDRYYYFDFPDQSVDDNTLSKILDFIVPYEKVVVFHGRFQNLVRQDAVFSDISGTQEATNTAPADKDKFFFEPSLSKILEFFEKQIFASIFEQTIRESQLAKIASRLTTLDTASENIGKQLGIVTLDKSKTLHRQQNKKQLETFSSRVLWGNS
jgi:ATP synthase F1 gamma subunit